MKTIKIKQGSKYPRLFDILWFVTKWYKQLPTINATFVMPELDSSYSDPVDSQDWKKLFGVNLCITKPSDYKAFHIGFRANHETGNWDFVAYINSPDFEEKFINSDTLVSVKPNTGSTVKLFPLNDTKYAIQFFNAGEPISELYSYDFRIINSMLRLSSTHYGGKDDNNDGIGNGYPGPSKYFKLKLDLDIN